MAKSDAKTQDETTETAQKEHEKSEFVPKFRVCALCRGKGNRYSKTGRKRYYKCQNCGFTWTYVLSHTQVAEEAEEDAPGRENAS